MGLGKRVDKRMSRYMALDSYTDTKSTWYDCMKYIGVSGTRDTERQTRFAMHIFSERDAARPTR
jgi:hypothetical protein